MQNQHWVKLELKLSTVQMKDKEDREIKWVEGKFQKFV